MFAKIKDGVVEKYPYTLNDLKAENPQTSYPNGYSLNGLESQGIVPVLSLAAVYDASTQVAELDGCEFVNGRWKTKWMVRSKTPQEAAEWLDALTSDIVDQTQARLDAFAATRNYAGILSACTYATSNNPVFQVEGKRAVQLRDATWEALFAIIGEVRSGARAVTCFSDVEGDLPALSWV